MELLVKYRVISAVLPLYCLKGQGSPVAHQIYWHVFICDRVDPEINFCIMIDKRGPYAALYRLPHIRDICFIVRHTDGEIICVQPSINGRAL